MKTPFISRGAHDLIIMGLKDWITSLEASLARKESENRDLTNALAASSRAPIPFAAKGARQVVDIGGRADVFRRQRQLERMNQAVELAIPPEVKNG